MSSIIEQITTITKENEKLKEENEKLKEELNKLKDNKIQLNCNEDYVKLINTLSCKIIFLKAEYNKLAYLSDMLYTYYATLRIPVNRTNAAETGEEAKKPCSEEQDRSPGSVLCLSFLRQHERANEIEQDAGSPAAGQDSPGNPDDRGVNTQPLGDTAADAADFLVPAASVDPAVGLVVGSTGEILEQEISDRHTSRNGHNRLHRLILL